MIGCKKFLLFSHRMSKEALREKKSPVHSSDDFKILSGHLQCV